jgi:hypothetical protein
MNFGKHWIGIAFGWIMVNIGMVGTIVYVSSSTGQLCWMFLANANSNQGNHGIFFGEIPQSIYLRVCHSQYVANLRRICSGVFPACLD